MDSKLMELIASIEQGDDSVHLKFYPKTKSMGKEYPAHWVIEYGAREYRYEGDLASAIEYAIHTQTSEEIQIDQLTDLLPVFIKRKGYKGDGARVYFSRWVDAWSADIDGSEYMIGRTFDEAVKFLSED